MDNTHKVASSLLHPMQQTTTEMQNPKCHGPARTMDEHPQGGGQFVISYADK